MTCVATAAKVSAHTLRDHRQAGRFDPGDLVSVAGYIVGQRLLKEVKCRADRDPGDEAPEHDP